MPESDYNHRARTYLTNVRSATSVSVMLRPVTLVDARNCQEGTTKPTDRKETHPMHDILVAAAFLMMVILPCIVTMGSGATEEDGDEA